MPKKRALPRKIRLFAYGDSPTIPSGFATVMKNLFYYLALTGKYEIDIFGINDRGNWKDPKEHPYHVYQAMPPGETDPYGRSRFVDTMRGGGLDLQPNWDIVFFLNDPFVLENPIPFFNIGTLPAVKDIQKTHYLKLPPETWFKTVGYFPVDSPVKPHWVLSAISQVDYPVAYADYGKKEILKADKSLDNPTNVDPLVIPHGHNFNDYYPLPKEAIEQFKRDYFKGAVREETFLVISVGRNQRRKDLPRVMKVFKEFQRRRPDSFLYIHAEEQEAWGSLRETALQFGLRQGFDWNYPQSFIATKGFPTNILNAIYNAADVHLSCTQGEGWGLPITEAMGTKTVNLVPNHSAISEIINSAGLNNESLTHPLPESTLKVLRGIPVKAGSTSSEWINHGSPDLERIRPLTNVDDAVAKLLWVYDHPQEVKQITSRAYKWLKGLDWKHVVNTWDKLFTKAFYELEAERANPDKVVKKWANMRIFSRPHPQGNQSTE